MNLDFLNDKLENRKKNDSYRNLPLSQGLIDFSSNDYLGIARSGILKTFQTALLQDKLSRTGSTASRLIAGNSERTEEIEWQLARFHHAEAALLYGSGYAANLGLISCIASKNDVILYDELCHASIRDGIRLSHASSYSFRHNDVQDLEKKLIRFSSQKIFVIVESVYSMDGDEAPLKRITELINVTPFYLIVDEAHALGWKGLQGEGLVSELNLEASVFARIFTFGKSAGIFGALIAGSEILRNYLINYSRPFIYSTALPEHVFETILHSYDVMKVSNNERVCLIENIKYFKVQLREAFNLINSSSPIQGVLFPGNSNARSAANILQKKGFDIKAILSPTVPLGTERLRISLHSYNTREEISGLVSGLLSIK